jgi:hypothetical protein
LNKLIFIIIFFSIIFFSIGLSVGVYKFFPYYEIDEIKRIILSEDTSNKKYVMNKFIYDVDVDSQIHIFNSNDLEKKRSDLINYIWNQELLPTDLPTEIHQNIYDSNYVDMKNLKQINQIEHKMEFKINSVSYMFIPKISNDKLVIYHQGHGGDFLKGKNTIDFFLNNGFTVLAFSMPLLGINDKPIIHTEEYGTFILNTHDHLKYLESKNFNPIKLFFEPILVSINYLEKNFHYDEYYMVGISGGAWTAMYYSAIDDRITQTYPVAGPYPLFIRSNYNTLGDYETEHTGLLKIVNELETFVLGSHGKDRKFVQIYNKYDSCCWDGDYFNIFEEIVKEKNMKLGGGYYDVILDDTHHEHIISDHALNLIKNSMDSN